MNGIGAMQQTSSAPWGGLPSAQQPWGGAQLGTSWQAAQQAPWRLSPWQTQGMPSGTPAQAPPTPPPVAPLNYLPQGSSGNIPGFNPATPGGGFYPDLIGFGGAGAGGPQQQQGGGVQYRDGAGSWQTPGGPPSGLGQTPQNAPDWYKNIQWSPKASLGGLLDGNMRQIGANGTMLGGLI